MAGIKGPNLNQVFNQTVYNAVTGENANQAQASNAVTAEAIYNLFFKEVKTKKEFKKKIRGTLRHLNSKLDEQDIDDILDSLDMPDQPPFCASYSEEGLSEQLNLEDGLVRSDIYDVFLMFYSRLYDEANKSIG